MWILSSIQQWIVGFSYVSTASTYVWLEYIKGIRSGMEFLLLFFGLATGWVIWRSKEIERKTAKLNQEIAQQKLHEMMENHEQDTLKKAYENEHLKFD